MRRLGFLALVLLLGACKLAVPGEIGADAAVYDAHEGRGADTGADADAATDADARGDVRDAPDDSLHAKHFALRGGRFPGGAAADVEIRDGRIVAVGDVSGGAPAVDLAGAYLVPAFIDSHVHLAYLPLESEMLAGGIAAAIDLAAPESFLSAEHGKLRVLASGPMITSPGGYPLDSWGKDGYGIGCADPVSAVAAVDRLNGLGARVIKVPLTDPGPDDATFRAAVDRAHELGLKVAVHALSESAAHRGAIAGADVLAHMPVELLTEETLATWANRVVVSTLSAFGGAAATENAKAMRETGAVVLYGTDFGNTMTPGIDGNEIAELVAAGFDGAAILAAGTSLPAAFWGFDDLGAIEVGKRASLLVVADDPLVTPGTLASPLAVYVDGELISSVRSGSTKSQHRAAPQ